MSSVDLSWRKYILPPIHKEGPRFVGIFFLVSLFFVLLYKPMGIVGMVATIWCFYFFRDPDRIIPDIDDAVLSPADGYVQMIRQILPPEELGLEGESAKQEMTCVSVFMSVFDVHVNRVPATGKIVKTAYIPGKFLNATLDKASKDNERQAILMETAQGKKLCFVQIAGLVARRILCDVVEGQEVTAGERFGLIRFGSRLDIYLPADIAPQVCAGQKVVAGETVLAKLTGPQEQLNGQAG